MWRESGRVGSWLMRGGIMGSGGCRPSHPKRSSSAGGGWESDLSERPKMMRMPPRSADSCCRESTSRGAARTRSRESRRESPAGHVLGRISSTHPPPVRVTDGDVGERGTRLRFPGVVRRESGAGPLTMRSRRIAGRAAGLFCWRPARPGRRDVRRVHPPGPCRTSRRFSRRRRPYRTRCRCRRATSTSSGTRRWPR